MLLNILDINSRKLEVWNPIVDGVKGNGE